MKLNAFILETFSFFFLQLNIHVSSAFEGPLLATEKTLGYECQHWPLLAHIHTMRVKMKNVHRIQHYSFFQKFALQSLPAVNFYSFCSNIDLLCLDEPKNQGTNGSLRLTGNALTLIHYLLRFLLTLIQLRCFYLIILLTDK